MGGGYKRFGGGTGSRPLGSRQPCGRTATAQTETDERESGTESPAAQPMPRGCSGARKCTSDRFVKDTPTTRHRRAGPRADGREGRGCRGGGGYTAAAKPGVQSLLDKKEDKPCPREH